ncbi:Fc receptor-like protein [Sarotherodon galilaeus]
MHKKVAPYPEKISAVFCKGPLGYLLQDPSKEAQRIKNDPKLQDKSAPMREDLVRQNALTVVYQRGGDASDMKEVQGEYILQFGKYKGKSFRWLLENDVGYTMYLIKDLQKEEAAGTSVEEGHGKESLHSFVHYALSFTEIKTLLDYEASRVNFIMRKSCSQGTRMHKLQQYLRKKQQSASASTNAPTKPLGKLF